MLVVGPGDARAQATACTLVPLRDALQRVAAEAGVRLSYSRELVDLDRTVCAPAPGQPVLAALDSLLRGTGVEAVTVGGGQIVLAPSPHATGDATGSASRPAVLDRIVVTGSPAGAPARSLPVALSVLDGSAFGPRAATPLATALDGVVPGLWLWNQPTTSLLARYGSLRGASSFGLTTPKLYLDGVEVANPLFVTALSADQIERIEVIRGPQGAALYGADAISGVINVITRHDGADGGPAVTLRSGVGAAATAFATRPAFTQDYGLTVRTGSGAQTAGASIGLAALGPVVPGSTAHQLTALADARRVGQAGVLTLTARFADAVAPPDTDLFATAGTGTTATRTTALTTQHLSELTLAANAVRTTGGRWTHTLTAGLDAYQLSGVSAANMAALSSQLDSTQRTARGGAARGTLRASTTATYDAARDLAVTVTGIADYGLLRDATRLGNAAYPGETITTLIRGRGGYDGMQTAGPGYVPVTPVTWLGTAGLVGQTTLAWRDAVFVTAGLRGERNDGFTSASRAALLPSLGVSTVHTLGDATLKLRTAYGSGLRPVQSAARQMSWHAAGGGALPSSLAPESQTGVEGGADLFVGGRGTRDGAAATTFAVHVTGYSQLASGLVQQVAFAPNGADGGGPESDVSRSWNWPRWGPQWSPEGHLDYVLQNVGAIANRGFEGEAQLRLARGAPGVFTLGTTLAYVDSRVRRTAYGYTGELRAGDRMLEVPRWTLGATAGWRAAGWTTNVAVSRAADWINYDRVRLDAAVLAGQSYSAITGPAVRAYWRSYAGVTRLRADITRDLSRGLAVVLTGENLLDRQRGEPDNVTVLPGRTLTAGVRAQF
ncbi:hypothetical protein tb265_18710 [Gemmatimonadetes bacterium T265]|nr:hypothetical protein tb265_18710 [Gemmatimonadetes bacterium T265]